MACNWRAALIFLKDRGKEVLFQAQQNTDICFSSPSLGGKNNSWRSRRIIFDALETRKKSLVKDPHGKSDAQRENFVVCASLGKNESFLKEKSQKGNQLYCDYKQFWSFFDGSCCKFFCTCFEWFLTAWFLTACCFMCRGHVHIHKKQGKYSEVGEYFIWRDIFPSHMWFTYIFPLALTDVCWLNGSLVGSTLFHFNVKERKRSWKKWSNLNRPTETNQNLAKSSLHFFVFYTRLSDIDSLFSLLCRPQKGKISMKGLRRSTKSWWQSRARGKTALLLLLLLECLVRK